MTPRQRANFTTMSKLPQGQPYSGPSGALKKPSPWLAAEDIGEREVKVTIETAEIFSAVEFDQGRTEQNVGALKFVGKEKRMVLNSTNRKALVNLYGMSTADWQGKPVVLFVDFNVRMMGKKVAGLRIKAAPDSVRTISKPESLASEVSQ